jgi:phosphatidylinositol alpha-mannosyltransferase
VTAGPRGRDLRRGPLRVGLVCPYSLDVPGGVQNHVLGLARSLTGRGHQVEVLAPGARSAGAAAPLPAYVTTTGRTVPLPHNGSVARVCFGPVAAARVRRWLAAGRFDLVHVHEPATPSLSVLALWAATPPVVATFHTAQDRGWALGTSAATVLRPGLRKIAAHVAVSEAAGRTLSRYLPVQPVVVPNGIDRRAFASPAAGSGRPPGPQGASGPPPRVLFVGRLDEPRKGLRVLLEALPAVVERHPGVHLTVVGPGTPPTVPAVLAPRVSFAGAVDDRVKAALLSAASGSCSPKGWRRGRRSSPATSRRSATCSRTAGAGCSSGPATPPPWPSRSTGC